MNNFRKLLAEKEMHENKRYQQKEIASQVGISKTTVSRMIHQDQFPNVGVYTALKVANWLDCKMDDLFDLPQNKQENESN